MGHPGWRWLLWAAAAPRIPGRERTWGADYHGGPRLGTYWFIGQRAPSGDERTGREPELVLVRPALPCRRLRRTGLSEHYAFMFVPLHKTPIIPGAQYSHICSQ